MNWHHLRDRCFDLLAPRHCVFCGIRAEGDERSICQPCRNDMPWRSPAMMAAANDFVVQVALLDYCFPVDVALKRFKFGRKLHYGAAFAELLCEAAPLLPGGDQVPVATW